MIPVGDAPVFVAKVIAGHVAGHLGLAAEVLAPVAKPFHAFDEKRCQYNAGIVLKYLESLETGRFEKAIAVMEEDLFVPIFTHVFGEAEQGGGSPSFPCSGWKRRPTAFVPLFPRFAKGPRRWPFTNWATFSTFPIARTTFA